MKKSMTLKSLTLAALLGLAFSGSVLAQPGPGMGGGSGMGGGMGGGSGMGGGADMGGMRMNQNNMPGWTLMTPEERTATQAKMRAAKTYEECKQVQEAHRQDMQARAKEKGVTLATPRQNACDNMKARGFFK